MLPVVSTVAALAAVALVAMSMAVSLRRKKVGVSIGFGDDVALMRRIRAQGNFIEYVPLALIVLALLEYRQVPAAWLWVVAVLLIAGRCLHYAGMLSGTLLLRVPGMIGTYGALLVGAGCLLFL